MGVFDDEELEPEQPRRDTELTLSSMMLLAIFFGLVLICGLCFGLGYTLGHRGSQQPLTAGQTSTGAQPTLQADISLPKPSATAPIGAAPEQQNVVVDLPQAADSGRRSCGQFTEFCAGRSLRSGPPCQPLPARLHLLSRQHRPQWLRHWLPRFR